MKWSLPNEESDYGQLIMNQLLRILTSQYPLQMDINSMRFEILLNRFIRLKSGPGAHCKTQNTKWMLQKAILINMKSLSFLRRKSFFPCFTFHHIPQHSTISKKLISKFILRRKAKVSFFLSLSPKIFVFFCAMQFRLARNIFCYSVLCFFWMLATMMICE